MTSLETADLLTAEFPELATELHLAHQLMPAPLYAAYRHPHANLLP